MDSRQYHNMPVLKCVDTARKRASNHSSNRNNARCITLMPNKEASDRQPFGVSRQWNDHQLLSSTNQSHTWHETRNHGCGSKGIYHHFDHHGHGVNGQHCPSSKHHWNDRSLNQHRHTHGRHRRDSNGANGYSDIHQQRSNSTGSAYNPHNCTAKLSGLYLPPANTSESGAQPSTENNTRSWGKTVEKDIQLVLSLLGISPLPEISISWLPAFNLNNDSSVPLANNRDGRRSGLFESTLKFEDTMQAAKFQQIVGSSLKLSKTCTAKVEMGGIDEDRQLECNKRDERESYFQRSRDGRPVRYSDPSYGLHNTKSSLANVVDESVEFGKFRYSNDPIDLSGQTDIGDVETPMLLLRELSQSVVSESALYEAIHKFLENNNHSVSHVKDNLNNTKINIKRVLLAKHTNGSSSSIPIAGFAFVEFTNLPSSKKALSILEKRQLTKSEPLLSHIEVSYVSLGSFQPATQDGILSGNAFKTVTGQFMEYWNKNLRLVEYPSTNILPYQNDVQQTSEACLIPHALTELSDPAAKQPDSKLDVEDKPKEKFTMKLSNSKITMKPISLVSNKIQTKGTKTKKLMSLDDSSWKSTSESISQADYSGTGTTTDKSLEISPNISKLGTHRDGISDTKAGWTSIGGKANKGSNTNARNIKIGVMKKEPLATLTKNLPTKNAALLSQLNKWKSKHAELIAEEDEKSHQSEEGNVKQLSTNNTSSSNQGNNIPNTESEGSLHFLNKTEKGKNAVIESDPDESSKLIDKQISETISHLNKQDLNTEDCVAVAEELRHMLVNKRRVQSLDKRQANTKSGWKKVWVNQQQQNSQQTDAPKTDEKGQKENIEPQPLLSKGNIEFTSGTQKLLEEEKIPRSFGYMAFLPSGSNEAKSSELKRTPDTSSSYSTERQVDSSTSQQQPFLPDSLGFGARMLQKMGWSVNTGLGLNSSGIKEAIIPNAMYSSGAGLGASQECVYEEQYEKSVQRGNLKRKMIQETLRDRAMKRLNR